MTAVTSADLEAFAVRCRGEAAWTPDLQQELMDLIREPAMATCGQRIPPNDRTKAMDNLYRCKPTAWLRWEQEQPGKANVAGFQLWRQDLGDAAVNLKVDLSSGPVPYSTMMLAMTAATALVWAHLLKEIGR